MNSDTTLLSTPDSHVMFSQNLKHHSQAAAHSQTAATQQNVRGPLRCLSGKPSPAGKVLG